MCWKRRAWVCDDDTGRHGLWDGGDKCLSLTWWWPLRLEFTDADTHTRTRMCVRACVHTHTPPHTQSTPQRRELTYTHLPLKMRGDVPDLDLPTPAEREKQGKRGGRRERREEERGLERMKATVADTVRSQSSVWRLTSWELSSFSYPCKKARQCNITELALSLTICNIKTDFYTGPIPGKEELDNHLWRQIYCMLLYTVTLVQGTFMLQTCIFFHFFFTRIEGAKLKSALG